MYKDKTSSAAMPLPTRPSLPRSDLEEAALTRQNQQNAAQYALDQVGMLLNKADETLGDITDQGMLGTAMIRGCKEVADGIGSLANHIEQQSHDDRRALAQACIQDAQSSLLLMDEAEGRSGRNTAADGALTRDSTSSSEELANLSEDQVMGAIHAAATLLRDVEDTLRAIERDEMEEIADVALTVARIFVASLQSVHSTLTPDHLITAKGGESAASNRASRSGPRIDILDSDDEQDDSSPTKQRSFTPPKSSAASRRNDRFRLLWPPLGPAVSSTLNWGKETATQKPILAVALGLTLWPWAVVTACVATPLVLMDRVVQQIYSNFQDAPLVVGIERTAAQVYQARRLSFLCSKLMVRQSLRVVSRQVNRHGGVGRLVCHVGGFALNRVTHPIETVGMVWDGVTWSAEAVVGAWKHLNDPEHDETVQGLQQ